MKFELTEVLGNEPVELEQAKLFCRIDHDHEDQLIEALITTARQLCEGIQRRALPKQTLRLYLDEWPDGPIILPRPPLREVLSITYTDTDGQEHTLEDYEADKQAAPALVYPDDTWPGAKLAKVNPIVVEYEAGYDEDVPKPTMQALLLLVSHLYENREFAVDASIDRVPWTIETLLQHDRVWY